MEAGVVGGTLSGPVVDNVIRGIGFDLEFLFSSGYSLSVDTLSLYTSGRVNCGSPFFSLTSLFVVVVVLVASVWFISIDDVCPLVS